MRNKEPTEPQKLYTKTVKRIKRRNLKRDKPLTIAEWVERMERNYKE